MKIADFRGEIKLNEPLAGHTSYRIGGPADVLAYPENKDDLCALLKYISEKGLKYFILGNGTNLLVRDGGYRGVVISLERMNAVTIERQYRSLGGMYSIVRAEGGATLHRLLSAAVEKGLTGLEFAAGIPGTVGGAVCMNAGTTAGEIGDIIDTVTLISPQCEPVVKSREELSFGYRTANIPAGHLIFDIKIILRHGEQEKIRSNVRELMAARRERQPSAQPNAGSVFKNPLDESAGKLIETAGLKGKTVGGARVSEKHANFIVNTGKAKASDVIALMELVKEKVLEVHKIRLEPEIKIIGED